MERNRIAAPGESWLSWMGTLSSSVLTTAGTSTVFSTTVQKPGSGITWRVPTTEMCIACTSTARWKTVEFVLGNDLGERRASTVWQMGLAPGIPPRYLARWTRSLFTTVL